MPYEPKNYSHLLSTPGLSDMLLNNHFTLYQGYVKNTNLLSQTLNELLGSDKAATPEYAELSRRFGWEWNGMRLHELYFDNLSKEPTTYDATSELIQKIEQTFESVANWEKDFRAKAAMRGIGWVILSYDKATNQVFNVWINEHDGGHLSGTIPLLVMDVFEHAYITDYGIKRAYYINAFFQAIHCTITERRFVS